MVSIRQLGLAGILFFVLSVAGCQSLRRAVVSEPFASKQIGHFTYSQFVPETARNYRSDRSLFLVLHPSGSSGEEFIQRWIPLLNNGHAVILAPTATNELPYGSPEFEDVLWQVLNQFGFEADSQEGRLFLIGESNGAIFGFRLVAQHPSRFEKTVLISGALESQALHELLDSPKRVSAHLLMVHGQQDELFDIEAIKTQVKILEENQVPVELRVIQDMKHGADPFTEEEIAKWLNSSH
ncbi:MAG: hypothetical protein COV74_07970 [Candidatus Omnitrophica bacterium CG11_big_fil_rev_8_21_14_0_20_45_26]|uniref:Phospholipase/carboxylesterase/thioesterase domain-containing protein n=1 Tax=Candidatus Abzuiibacterium crystallinum TaxID=1974748 RepID=A0A2H0LMR5_9BACT|nr:MAG: hypothetical protein COV74_07970 [Candidatus Omnitrophica bacterium CG11_big_fil_rev_8_21_14_0_20_45_26]PIW65157.1 MAG: hypothetical protein COW12_03010 [Candidatus Omnitrophica bacterium CG12_big_fil_rev_8_21_14_0_65_45_16]